MSRRVARDTDPRKKKKAPRPLETAEDFMAAGVIEEDNGDRWKGSDDPKAGRFYVKAMEIYESALQRYPNNLDAMYNLARLQYQITQLSLPSSFFPPSSTEVKRLQAAAGTHRQCVASPGGAEIPDLLFNYGQVMASLAEAYMASSDGNGDNARQALEESITLFKSCLSSQEREIMERNKEIAVVAATAAMDSNMEQGSSENQTGVGKTELSGDLGGMQLDAGASMDGETGAAIGGGVKLGADEEHMEEENKEVRRRESSVSSTSTNGGQWALVTEAATEDSLLDTALALLEVYTTFCTLLPSPQLHNPRDVLRQIEAAASELMETYLLPLAAGIQSTERKVEALLARAGFLVGVTEAAIKNSGSGDAKPEGWVASWEGAIKSAFEPYDFFRALSSSRFSKLANPTESSAMQEAPFDFLTTSWRALCDRSTAYSTAAATAASSPQELTAAWTLYTCAANDLASAVKVCPESRKSEIYLARGNLELERAMLSMRGSEAAEKNKITLRKNALVYYKAAVNSGKAVIGASVASAQSKAAAEANVKAAVVRRMQGEEGALEELMQVERVPAETVREVLLSGADDGLWEGGVW